MLRMENNVLTIVRKDTGTMRVAVSGYTLQNGDTLTLSISEELDTETPAVSLTSSAFVDNGCTFELTSEHTNLEPGTYYYDVQLNRADGSVDTIIGPDKMKVIGGVTW